MPPEGSGLGAWMCDLPWLPTGRAHCFSSKRMPLPIEKDKDTLLAAYRARSDPWLISFVVLAYGALMLFFWCIRAFETAPAARKGPLMVAICSLAMFLIVLFSYRVASMMPFGFAVAVWTVAGVSVAAGFSIMFIFGRGFNKGNRKADGARLTGQNQQN